MANRLLGAESCVAIAQTLSKAQRSLLIGRIDEALKLYLDLLRLTPKPPINQTHYVRLELHQITR